MCIFRQTIYYYHDYLKSLGVWKPFCKILWDFCPNFFLEWAMVAIHLLAKHFLLRLLECIIFLDEGADKRPESFLEKISPNSFKSFMIS